MLFFDMCDHKFSILMNASLQVGGIIRRYFSLVSDNFRWSNQSKKLRNQGNLFISLQHRVV